MADPVRVVYDAMVFLQAVVNPAGPAFRCFQLAETEHVKLLISPAIIAELHDVLNRPQLRTRFKRLTPENVTEFLQRVLTLAEHSSDPPNLFALPRDPHDQIYLNLALNARAA